MGVKGKTTLAGREDPNEAVEEKEVAEQSNLVGIESAKPETPKPVRGKFILAKYVKPHYEIDAKDNYSLSMEFSFPLAKEHEPLLTTEVNAWWKRLKNGGTKKIVDIEVGPHAVAIHLAPDDAAIVSIGFATIKSVSLALIEETGSGTAQQVIRYSFRVNAELDDQMCYFADRNFNKMVWLKLKELQGKLALQGE